MNDQLDRIEGQRVRLEANVQRLRASLHYWQTWDAEYDALREEVSALPENASSNDVRQLAVDFASDVIKSEDIEELIGAKLSMQRSRGQIATLITRRMDYVQQNSRSVEKQLHDAQSQLGHEEDEASPSNAVRDSVPTADIIEELDENEHLITGTVAKPGEKADDIVNMLRKAGVKDDGKVDDEQARPAGARTLEVESGTPSQQSQDTPLVDHAKRSDSQIERKKSVTFAEDTKPAAPTVPAASTGSLLKGGKTPDIKEIVNGSFKSTDKVYQIGDDDRPFDFHSPHIPTDESPEDAALRRKMLEYNMQEVGAVVAQMNLDQDDSDQGFSSDDDEIDLSETTDEEEDKYGRSLKSGVSDQYRREMMELEKKLNARSMKNVGPASSAQTLSDENFSDESATAAASTDPSPSKSVRFASELDVAPSAPQVSSSKLQSPQEPTKPVASTVVEHGNSPESTAGPSGKPGKISKFKQAKLDAKRAPKSTEANGTLLSDVVERPPKAPANVAGKKISQFKASRTNDNAG